MTAIFGSITFVESSRPPKPVSITATSTFFCLKYQKAMADVVSKNVLSIRRISAENNFIYSTIFSSAMGTPFTRIRSLNRTR